MRNTSLCSLMLAAFTFLTFNAFAQTTWIGLVSTDWNTAGNWNAGIPDPADDVIIAIASNKPVIGAGTTAVAKSVKITVAAQLTIGSTASLSINGSGSAVFALENLGTLDNSGTIKIGDVSPVANRGIVHRNGGTLNNKPGGLIQIDQTSAAEAFYSTGIVNNEGNIQIGGNAAVVGHGIKIEGNAFSNKMGGSIKIDRASVHGIDLGATITPAPVLNNEGSIQIGSQANVTGLGIVVRAGCTINNKPGGSVTIDRTGGNGIELTGAAAALNNEALIQIGSQANVGGTALVNRNGCTFNNKVGGDIRINQANGSIYNNGTFSNNALITIDNDTRKAQDGIFNESSGNFSNNATGIISIKKPWGNGIWNYFGNFANSGKITIRDIYNRFSGDYSTGILNYGTFSSTSTAEIYLDEVGGGIISIGAVTNAGIIRMGENGILSAYGIINVQANGVFTNSGDISIKQAAKGGVQNDAPSSFFNNACAQLAIFGGLNNSGTFINSGLFRVNSPTQGHNNTALTNDGILEYAPGSFIIPNVTNNDVAVKSATGECIVPNVLELGGMNSFTVGTTWYSDPALTTPAGIYNQAANSFSYSPSAEGNYLFYFTVSDGTNGCTRTVSIRLTYDDVTPPTIACPPTQSVGTTPGQCTGIATFTTPTGADNCTSVPPLVALTGGLPSGSSFPKGTTTVTFRATDATGLTKTCTFRVLVNDTQLPAFTLCPSSQTVSCSTPLTYPTPSATDNCGAVTVTRIGGPASGSTFPAGNTTVTWRAIDGAGRSSTCTFVVTVSDNLPPSITCPQNMVQNNPANDCNTPVVYTTPTATDNCGINALFLLSGLASGSVFPVGTTSVIWQASDVNGLSTNCSFSVTVTCGSARPNPAADRTSNKSVSIAAARQYALNPNPASETTQITWSDNGSTPVHVAISDAQGRLVWEQTTLAGAQTLRVDVSNWAAGVYYVSLRDGETAAVKRLVVGK